MSLDAVLSEHGAVGAAPRPPLPEPTEPVIEAPLLPMGEPGELDDSRRLFRLQTVLSADKRLYLHTLRGREAVCAPFAFTLELVSLNANIELKEMLSTPLVVAIAQTTPGAERYIHGYVSHFAFERTDASLATYRAQVSPWTHFMSLRVNTRIFQDLTIVQIAERVFKEYGLAADFEFRLRDSYRPQDFVVQYQESDFAFVSRLFHKEGWVFFFEHRQDGHRLVITDDSPNRAFCPPLPLYDTIEFNDGRVVTRRNSVTSLRAERELQPGKVSLNTFDYQNPRGMLAVDMPTLADQGRSPVLEVYDGTPGFAYDNAEEGRRYARQRSEAFDAHTKTFAGTSDCPDLRPGRSFVLTGHFWFDAHAPEPDRLLLLDVAHEGRNNLPARLGGAEQTAVYTNAFTSLRAKIPFRPLYDPRTKPVIPGLQTATVTGPPGKEIWTNKNGCIKVQFHWDRYGRRDHASSCWIRVAQGWAGARWGSVAIPRIGQEVLVGFMEGNPDRPVVLGSLFNEDQPVPYELPAGAHMMGFKSNSTPGGNGYSEMVIHDTKGSELVNIHGQKDMVTTVRNNQKTVVMGPEQTIQVTTGTQSTTVKKAITVESQTEHIALTGKTDIQVTADTGEVRIRAATQIVLEVGQSRLTMTKDGLIEIEGVQVTVKGSNRIDLNP